jgi:hypothetical protein
MREGHMQISSPHEECLSSHQHHSGRCQLPYACHPAIEAAGILLPVSRPTADLASISRGCAKSSWTWRAASTVGRRQLRIMPASASLTPFKASRSLHDLFATCERRLDVAAACLHIPGLVVTGSFHKLSIAALSDKPASQGSCHEHIQYTRSATPCALCNRRIMYPLCLGMAGRCSNHDRHRSPSCRWVSEDLHNTS